MVQTLELNLVFTILLSDEAYIGCYKDTVNHVMTHELTAASK